MNELAGSLPVHHRRTRGIIIRKGPINARRPSASPEMNGIDVPGDDSIARQCCLVGDP